VTRRILGVGHGTLNTDFPDAFAPDPVTPTISATAVAGDEIDIAWTISTTTDAEFVVFLRGDAPGGPYADVGTIETIGTLTGTFTDAGLTANTTYYYVARSYTPASEAVFSAVSTEDSATTPAVGSTLAQPANLTLTETARTEDTITYTFGWDAVTGVDSYDWWVEPSVDGGYEDASSASPNNTVSTSVAGIVVTRGTGQDETVFVVAGRDGNGQGANTRLAVTIDGNFFAPSLTSVILTGDDAAITYTEDDRADAVDTYEIERKVGSGSYSVLTTKAAGVAQPQHTDSNLAAGTYTYRVRGQDVDSGTYTVYSSERFVTVVSALTAGNALALGADGTVALSATAPTGGTAPYTYQWHRSTDGSKGAALSGATGLTHDDDTVINDTLYYYTLTATDAVAASVDYTQKQATPGTFVAPDVGFADFEDATLGDFLTAGTNPSNISSKFIDVVDDPTGIRGGKVCRMHFVRTTLAGAPDKNVSIDISVTPSSEEFGYGETFFMAGWLYIPTPEAHMLAAQRKIFYPQDSQDCAFGFMKVEGYNSTLHAQSIKFVTWKYPTGNKVYAPTVAGTVFKYDLWQHMEIMIAMNSAVGLQDGSMKCWKDGVLVFDHPNMWFKKSNVNPNNGNDTTARGFGKPFKIGEQTQGSPDSAVLFDEYRYWDNCAVSSTRIGPS
jgi:hypothetical protein